MKTTLKIALVAAFIFSCNSIFAQIKIGQINSQELITLMPERDSAEVKLKAYSDELQNQMEGLQVELNNKFQDYQKNASTMSQIIREQKEKDLNDLSAKIREFQGIAEQDFQKMQMEIMSPVFKKAQDAIQKVSAANGFTMVFDNAQGGVVYFDEKTCINILSLVKAELNITK